MKDLSCVHLDLLGYELMLILVDLVRLLDNQKKGTLIFTGATASIRGNKTTAAFSAGKHGLRALSQSLAKEFGQKDIHVGPMSPFYSLNTQRIIVLCYRSHMPSSMEVLSLTSPRATGTVLSGKRIRASIFFRIVLRR